MAQDIEGSFTSLLWTYAFSKQTVPKVPEETFQHLLSISGAQVLNCMTKEVMNYLKLKLWQPRCQHHLYFEGVYLAM